MKVGKVPLAIAVCFVVGLILLFSTDRKTTVSSAYQQTAQQPFVERPAVNVSLLSPLSGHSEERARDYLAASAKNGRPGVIAGMGALCSEFHFYDDVPNPDYTLLFTVDGTANIDVTLVHTSGDRAVKRKHATSIDGAFFTACGMLRKNR